MTESQTATETNEPQGANAKGGEAQEVRTTEEPKKQTETKEGDPKSGESLVANDTTSSETEEETSEREGAPESYEEFKLPEGYEKDEAVTTAFAEVARDLNLPQADAQKLVDKVLPVMQEQADKMQAELVDDWQKQARADPMLKGGEGFDANLAKARKAIKAYGDDDLQTLLNGPLGSNPSVLRMLVKAGESVSEDTFKGGTRGDDVAPEDDRAAAARKLYPTSAAKEAK